MLTSQTTIQERLYKQVCQVFKSSELLHLQNHTSLEFNWGQNDIRFKIKQQSIREELTKP